jgi:DNA invertase Pin-like site-specific DNA recombinase
MKMSEYAIYTRLSQGGRQGSIDQQIQTCRDYADTHDLQVGDIYNDGEFSSGFKDGDRPRYEALRHRIEADEIDGVIIRDDKRLARERVELYRLFADMIETDTELHIAEDGEVELNDIEGVVHLFMTSVQNEEKKKEIKRNAEGIKSKIEAGMPHGRNPRGMEYSKNKTELVPVTDADGNVTEVFKNMSKAVAEKDDGVSYADAADVAGIEKGQFWRLYQNHADKYRR